MSAGLPAITGGGVFTCLLSAMLVAGCFDQDPPVAPPVAQPSVSQSSTPLEATGELPPFLEIASEVPSSDTVFVQITTCPPPQISC